MMGKARELGGEHYLRVNIGVTVVAMSLATLFAAVFFRYSNNSGNVGVIYVLAVMLVARFTFGYVPGIIASLIGVVGVNYAFTYPFMKLNFSIEGYPVTFVGMMLVSTLTSALTTRFKQQSALLQEREAMLAEAEKETMRANLLRAVSHDLRTPLSGIIGMADTYLKNEDVLTEKQKSEMVEGISEDANWLLSMVENLLSVTRIRVGDTRVNKTPEPLEEVVAEAMTRLRKRLPDAEVHVRVPDEFLMVPMDAMLIEQVIMNLVENAVYHSGQEEGGIDLFVEKRGNDAEFHIRDYGRGIAPERLAVIFDGGGMENNASGDSHKGIGIGLTICKTIIMAHQGKIQAYNRDRGAEFIFTLPIVEGEADDK